MCPAAGAESRALLLRVIAPVPGAFFTALPLDPILIAQGGEPDVVQLPVSEANV